MDTGPKQRRIVNPRYKANIFSVLTFGWTLETFKLGYSRDINDSDLYAPLPEHRSDVLGDAMQRAWEHEVEKGVAADCKPSLWRVLFKVFGSELMLYGLILAAMEFIIRLQQPLFLGLLLRYFSPIEDGNNSTTSTFLSRLFTYYEREGNISFGEAVFFSCGVVFCSVANVMVQHPFMMGAVHIGMKMRVGVCSLIYRKALKVSIQAMSESGAGLVVNLMANDVNRFDTGPLFAHYLWIGPLETMLMTIYLYRELGAAAAYGALIIIAVVPFQIFLGTQTAYYRKCTALKSDERVRLMKEIIVGMDVIKMYTWEEPFQKIIDTVRRQEAFYIKMTSYVRGVILSFLMFTSRFGIFVTMLLYVGYTTHITVESVFFLTCYYNIMKQTMTLYFPQAVGQIAEMNVAVQRIRDYLLSEECELAPKTQIETNSQEITRKKRVTIIVDPITPLSRQPNTEAGSSKNLKVKDLRKDQVKVRFDDASSRWIKSSDKDDVQDINLQIFSGSLTTIIGAVGSGKSTLLHMILGELPCARGSLQTTGSVSYASQEPWLFVGSVRQNILFGQPFVKSRYMEVCRVCALERDISLFPHGDKTVVGERGVALSGGQRARINLARAVYKEADIYLLDDPLSAVDTQVAKHIFERCIKRYLANKTVVLVTHQLQFIKSVDQIVIMDKCKIIADGAFNDLNEQELSLINVMADKVREVREEDEPGSDPGAVSVAQYSTMSFFKRHNWSMLLDASIADQKPEAEIQTKGRVKGSVYREYFLAGAACPFVVIVSLMFLLAQACASASDYWISRWSNAEDHLTGDATVDNLLWAESGLSRRQFVLIFGIITLATVTVAILRSFMFFSLCMRSSIRYEYSQLSFMFFSLCMRSSIRYEYSQLSFMFFSLCMRSSIRYEYSQLSFMFFSLCMRSSIRYEYSQLSFMFFSLCMRSSIRYEYSQLSFMFFSLCMRSSIRYEYSQLSFMFFSLCMRSSIRYEYSQLSFMFFSLCMRSSIRYEYSQLSFMFFSLCMRSSIRYEYSQLSFMFFSLCMRSSIRYEYSQLSFMFFSLCMRSSIRYEYSQLSFMFFSLCMRSSIRYEYSQLSFMFFSLCMRSSIRYEYSQLSFMFFSLCMRSSIRYEYSQLSFMFFSLCMRSSIRYEYSQLSFMFFSLCMRSSIRYEYEYSQLSFMFFSLCMRSSIRYEYEYSQLSFMFFSLCMRSSIRYEYSQLSFMFFSLCMRSSIRYEYSQLSFMFFSLCMRSSIRLHDKMFGCIARSPMSFFHANPSGRILNRFSKDMGAVDELLPQAMIDCCQIMLNLVGVVVVILVTDITLLIPIVAAIIIFYILRNIYIRTTGAVKRLEGISKNYRVYINSHEINCLHLNLDR
ncbi:probable multidrug resistance-associated protein lethal(2)03659 isoform X2 [Choristoneura fumiferana]|uniref:probable multidrug resistance-associated protein lethal(2)03659 isoform X2 n=1 Tax=Choristoneura fumiferana TaxID=7141 RepID=UPI003D15D7B2